MNNKQIATRKSDVVQLQSQKTNKPQPSTLNYLKKKQQQQKSDTPVEESDEEEDENNDDEWFSDSSTSSNEGGLEEKEPRLTMYAAFTQYDVVKEVGKIVYNYHLTKNDQREFDLAWFDGAISIKLLQRMWPHQRTNHFPGMYNLARKNCLGRHLMRMQKWFPQDYDFFPQTFMLPTDYKEFKAQITGKRNKTFIVKPEASCQGKGIFLTRTFEDIEPTEHYVVQRYMHKPYLIEGYKFDLRIYVMLCGVNPLRIYIYKEGLSRFATVQYESPASTNLQNLFMHLTNYAINKESENFISNTNENDDDVGSKRSFSFVLRKIAQDFGEDRSQQVFDQIKDVIIKTMCIAQPHLQHLYKQCQPDDVENQMCFQVLGFDVMLDHNLKAQLLEVNQSPSFTTDSPLDYKIKKALITDTIKILNLSIKRKLKVKVNKRAEMQMRLLKSNQPISQSVQEKSFPQKEKGKSTINVQNPPPEIDSDQQKNPSQKIKTSQGGPKPTLAKQMNNKTSPRAQQPQIDVQKKSKQEKMIEKEQIRRKKMLQREKHEKELAGNYELIYPLVSYQEEFDKLDQMKALQNQALNGLQNINQMPGSKSQEDIPAQDDVEQIECKQSENLEVETQKDTQDLNSQQNLNVDDENNEQDLDLDQELEGKGTFKYEKEDPWKLQLKYMEFMEKAKELWESFTNGNAMQKQKKQQEQKEKEEEEQKRKLLQKQKLREKVRKQAEERKANEFQKQRDERITSYRPEQGLDQDGNLIIHHMGQNYYFQPAMKRNSSSTGESETRNQFRVLSQEIQPIKHFQLGSPQLIENIQYIQQKQYELQKNPQFQEFYLPQVDQNKSTMAPHIYQNVKKHIVDNYEQKYAYLLKQFQDQNQALPAVPALSGDNYQQTPQIRQQVKRNMKDQSFQPQLMEINTSMNNPLLQNKPPLSKQNQTYFHKREESESQSSRGNQVIRLKNGPQINQAKLNDLLNFDSLNQQNQKIMYKQSMSKQAQSINEAKVNGVNHYQIGVQDQLIRSLSLDKKELPKIQSVSKNNQSIQFQNQIATNIVQKRVHQKLLQETASVQPTFELSGLGIVGEKKQVYSQDIRSMDNQTMIQSLLARKKSHNRVLKIKDKNVSQNQILTTQPKALHISNSPLIHSSSYKNNAFRYM